MIVEKTMKRNEIACFHGKNMTTDSNNIYYIAEMQ